MSVMYPKDCLAYHMARPLFRKMDASSVPCSVYSEQMQLFGNQGLDTRPLPEVDALRFYQLSHALALIQLKFHPLEPLPPEYLELVEKFFTEVSIASRRALFYLIVICTRETRHLHNKSVWRPALKKKYGEEIAKYVCSLPDEKEAAMAIFKQKPPNAAVGPYVEALYDVFHVGTWSGGYGGKAWAVVTDCLRSFVNGHSSLVMLLDTAWTLSHNNGPIWNKGDFYKHYLPNKYLIKILDVQRAGLIPTFILNKADDDVLDKICDADIWKTNDKLHSLFDLPRNMNWQTVNDLGSVQTYGLDGSVGYQSKNPWAAKTKPTVPMLKIYDGFELPSITVKRAA